MNSKNFKYRDESENFLAKLFKTGTEVEKREEINRILSDNPSWPIYYNLSPQRQALLNWFEFDKNKTLLEIGAGCGALTGFFSQKCKDVTALELEEYRAEIVRKRHCDRKNLKVLSGNFKNISFSKKFNYISLIGVLEYAGRLFSESDKYTEKPFVYLLKKAKSLLVKNGILFIAIENKIGMKYFTGSLEDHYSRGYESIQDYPDYSGIRTFSLSEIRQILRRVGFLSLEIYFPFPDYKLPTQIFSQEYLNNNRQSLSTLFLTNYCSASSRVLLNPLLFAQTIKKANLLAEFSNSFLIIAKNK